MHLTKTSSNAGFTRRRFSVGGKAPGGITTILIAMKLTAFFLLVCALHVSGRTSSQTISLSAESITLEKAFREIKKQTGYYVVAYRDIVPRQNDLTVEVKNMPLTEFLDLILKDKGLTYNISGKNILVVSIPAIGDLKSPAFASLFTPPAEPIKGIVKDSTGMPLSGATVMNKRNKKSVQTNAKGEFNIEGEKDDALVISYVGFENQTIKVTGYSILAVLRASTSPLDEVQIKAYGTTSRRLNTGSITTIKGEDIAKQPVNNPLLALQGRVPNLVITPQSGRPGAGVSLQLRGQNSLAMTAASDRILTQPLIVVDGVPYTNNIDAFTTPATELRDKISALSFINSTDIESIDVLADADATSIYGSRGGNGVILITTKKGRAGATRINISASIGSSDIPKRLDMMNTEQYLAMRKEAYRNDLLLPPNASTAPNQKNATNYDLTVWDQTRYTDWQETFLGGHSKDYNATASISGGSSAVNYLISGTYTNQGSVLPGNYKNESGSGHFNLTGNSANGKLTANFNASYNSSVRSNPSSDFTRLAVTLAPNAPAIYKPNGELNWEPNPATGTATWENPFAQLLRGTDETTNTITVSSFISYNLSNNLQLKTSMGFNRVQFSNIYIRPISSMDPGNPFNTGSANRNTTSNRSSSFDPQILYTKQISEGRLEVLAGFSLQNESSESQYIFAGGYTDDALIKNLAVVPAGNIYITNTTSDYKYTAIFGRLNYNWKNKYIINLTGRRDGSSRFGPGEQFGNFWSTGASWILSEEKFIKERLSFLSFAKLRGSYGSAGNDNIGNYAYLELYDALPDGVQYLGVAPIATQGATNAYYHWEDIRKAELALEVGLMNDRILLSAAFWQTRSSDQLGSVPLPATVGAPQGLVTNQPAKIQNKGWDFMLNSTNISSKDFSWRSSVNLGLTRNKLLKKPVEGNFGLDTRIQEGDPFNGVIYVSEFKGVNPITGLYQFAKKHNVISEPVFSDKRIFIQPRYAGGASNTFSYKRLSLSVFLEFKKQIGKNFLYDEAFTLVAGRFINGRGNLPNAFLDRWQQQGDISSEQRLTSSSGRVGGLAQTMVNSDASWTDASYIRINNVSLSYSLPGSLKNKMHIQELTVYLNASNLWTITTYKGLDPQIQNVVDIPQLRNIVAGFRIGF